MPADIKKIMFKWLDIVWFHSFISSRFPSTQRGWLPLRLKECKHLPNHHHSSWSQACIQGNTKGISYNVVGLCLAINIFPLLKLLDLVICYYQEITAKVCVCFLWKFPLSLRCGCFDLGRHCAWCTSRHMSANWTVTNDKRTFMLLELRHVRAMS